MSDINLNFNSCFIDNKEIDIIKEKIKRIHNKIHSKEEYDAMPLGWLDIPIKTDINELNAITNAAKRLRSMSDVIISLGIGGSYLGSKAAIEMLGYEDGKVIFAGNNISGQYLKGILDYIESKDFSIIVISKSGTTLETALAFRILKDVLIKRYGKEKTSERIIAVTDKSKGVLKTIAVEEGYECFVIPDNIGGRYSVFTPAGLLTIAAAGVDIYEMIDGAKEACYLYGNESIDANPAYMYAAIRNMLYITGKSVEVLVNYEPSMLYFAEWWKQLFGESEGKEGKGIFPGSMLFTADLHSMGQFLQEGTKNVFETVLNFKSGSDDILIPYDAKNIDELNYLHGKSLNYINDIAYRGVKEAHESGGVPVITIDIPGRNPYYFGCLTYFFQKACAISGYIIDVNPFNQPGVEMYKKNIFKLLGK